ncbi:MAG: AAA family ATPase [Candidatus Eremiobacteraeota bacterium]|nr:AAA family ATPase [Candidatus Eremiobacteraeota bacterium]MCW5865829.1 AAA family ATPase [Candidatus Eremiobacteraeota bacterium]
MVLGKFMPPHLGHLYLVDFARRYADELTVVVGSLAGEPIEGCLRVGWMRELFPQLRVVHLTDENPQLPDQHPDFWNIWKRSLERVVARPIDLVFAGEEYGGPLAEVLGARFIPVNGMRSLVPVSGTQIRQNPGACWAYLPAPVRAHFVRRISIFGPESTGKSTLTARLAEHFQTLWVPEYARGWLEARGGQVCLADLPVISRAQRASEEALARQCGPLLFCDTDPSATPLWSEELFGGCDPLLEEAVGRYDLTLLCAPDVPWVEDCVRYRPEGGQAFWERCLRRLELEDRRVVHLSGSWERRWQQAVSAIQSLK